MAVTIENVKAFLQSESDNYNVAAEHYEILSYKKDDYMSVYIAKAAAFRNTARALDGVSEFIDGTLELEARPVLSGTEGAKDA